MKRYIGRQFIFRGSRIASGLFETKEVNQFYNLTIVQSQSANTTRGLLRPSCYLVHGSQNRRYPRGQFQGRANSLCFPGERFKAASISHRGGFTTVSSYSSLQCRVEGMSIACDSDGVRQSPQPLLCSLRRSRRARSRRVANTLSVVHVNQLKY